MRQKKALSELNKVFNVKRLVKATGFENYQEPHNYTPSAKYLNGRTTKEVNVTDIYHYEQENGPSCGYRNFLGEPCTLKAREHEMKTGLIILLKKGTTQEQFVDEMCSVITILEKYKIAGVAQFTEES